MEGASPLLGRLYVGPQAASPGEKPVTMLKNQGKLHHFFLGRGGGGGGGGMAYTLSLFLFVLFVFRP